ncbi:MAG: class I SAM-dependent methyltransferase [Anaerolineaceae bacterium]|nr:class I SAM-dependent methyltransferase [Anaerolineaceae bacterium]
MSIYRKFAEVYARGPYIRYNAYTYETFRLLIERYSIPIGSLLDIACGEGTFALKLAQDHWTVTGIDLSPEMINIAKEKNADHDIKLQFMEMNMSTLEFSNEFDVVTCWYDSLNYLLSRQELEQTFQSVFRSLKSKGIFIFDMNTIFSLAVDWQKLGEYVQQNSTEVFEVHQPTYDPRFQTARIQITAFLKRGDFWERIEETHYERAYPIECIRDILIKTGFTILDIFGDIRKFTAPEEDTPRIWGIARKNN